MAVVTIEYDFVEEHFPLVVFSFVVLRFRYGTMLAVACIGILWPENCAETPVVCLAIVC